jgi:hypothetical protein
LLENTAHGKSRTRGDIRHLFTRGKVVPMGNLAVTAGSGGFCSRGYPAENFDVLFFFATNIGNGVADPGATHIVITIRLKFLEPGRTFVQGIDDPGIFVRIGEQGGGGLWIHEQGSELSGGNLEPDFRELLGVMFAQVISEMILEVSEAELVFLFSAPFLVTTASAPVGDIAFGDRDIAFFQGPDDFRIGNVIMEEFIDQVAFEFWQAGNFSVAQALAERRGGRGRSGDDAFVRIIRGVLGCGGLDGAALDEGAFLFDAVRAVVEEVTESRR